MTRSRSLLLLVLSACSFDFDNPSEVKDLRVLALSADPPELTAMAAVTRVNLDALVVGADAGAMFDYTWSACAVLPTQGGFFGSSVTRCSPDAGSIEIAHGTAGLDGLGTQLAVPREILFLLGSGQQGLSLQLQAQLQVGDLFAVKKVTVSPTLHEGQEPNRNPTVMGLTIDGEDWPEDGGKTVAFSSCADDKRVTLPPPMGGGFGRDAGMVMKGPCRHEIEPLVADAGVNQTYFAVGFSGADEQLTERLGFSWFADQGIVEMGTTREPDPDFEIGQRTKVSTFWQEPTEKPAGPVTFWLVVRDGRGGESWLRRALVFP